MVTAAENEQLTRTGPGTVMGGLFRRYWVPFLQSHDIPEPDCPPVKVLLLSEKLLAFRDTDGNVGLIDEFCAHRGISLWFGRNEEGGIRCPYHGWKYDYQGKCLEVPSEANAEAVCRRMKLKSYPCIERGGVIWTYMGPPEHQPEEPGFEWISVPDTSRYVNRRWQECNYLQAMEGGIDGAHVSWLHKGSLDNEPMRKNSKGAQFQRDAKPDISIQDSPAGIMIAARRNADAGEAYWRITPWIMPWYTIIPPYGDHALHGHAWVPIDDENCWTWTFTHHPARPLSDEEHAAINSDEGIYAPLIPGTYRTVANKGNDYLMDRASQRAGINYSGITGIAMQDASLQESAGAIVDRTRENLCSTDTAIVMARRKLLKSAVALSENGTTPPGLHAKDQRIRSASYVWPEETELAEVVQDVIDAGAEPDTQHMTI